MLSSFFFLVKRFHLNSSHMSIVNIVIPSKMFQAQQKDNIFVLLFIQASLRIKSVQQNNL
jgi:hypothetical protein